MNKNKYGSSFRAIMLFAPGLPAVCAADGFVEDSEATFRTSNFYLNRDFREDAGVSKREEWAQGFILDYRSGYTAGTVGVGVDVLGMLGVKLDSGRGRSGTGLLPVDSDGRAPDDYSKLGVTPKARISQTELKVGTHVLKYPTISASTGRILPQTFQGGVLTSNEIRGLTLTFADINRTTRRDYSHSESMSLVNKNGRFAATPEADDFLMAGAAYAINPNLALTYQYGELEEVYGQHYLGMAAALPIGPGKLVSDLRLYLSDDVGSAAAGEIDNRTVNALFTYTLSGHTVGLGYQSLTGDTAMPYLIGTDAYLTNYMMASDFMERDERSWQARYAYNFSALGMPGLVFSTRYARGENARPATYDGEGRGWERDTELGYTFQAGVLKNLTVTWRNASMRSNFQRDIDENRLIIGYSLPLF